MQLVVLCVCGNTTGFVTSPVAADFAFGAEHVARALLRVGSGSTSTPLNPPRVWSTVSAYPLPFHVAAVSSAIEVSCEERVHYLLQLSAMLAVLCQSSTGLPLNAIRLGLWLFAFFFFFNYSEGCFLKRAISTSRLPLALGLHTQAAVAASQRTHKHACRWCKKNNNNKMGRGKKTHSETRTNTHTPEPSFGSCFPHNMC